MRIRPSLLFLLLTLLLAPFAAPSSHAATVATFQSDLPQCFALIDDGLGGLLVSQRNPYSRIVRISGTGTRTIAVQGQGLNDVVALAWGNGGDLYAADFGGGSGHTGCVWRISSAGVVALVTEAVARPAGLAVAPNGDLYVSEYFNLRIKRITPAGIVSTFASAVGPAGGALQGLEWEPDGSLLAGTKNGLYRVTSGGVVSAFATGFPAMTLVRAAEGGWFVSGYTQNQLLRVGIGGDVAVFAGTGDPGLLNGLAANAKFNLPAGLLLTNSGDVLVADFANQQVRVVVQEGASTAVKRTTWGRLKRLALP